MNEERLNIFLSRALKEGMLIRDRKLSYLILNFALKNRIYDRITELQSHNIEALERNFGKLQLDANSANYLANLCTKSPQLDPERVARIFELISNLSFDGADNLRTEERIEMMQDALDLLRKQSTNRIDRNCELLAQRIQDAKLQHCLEMEVRDRIANGQEMTVSEKLLQELRRNIFTEEVLLREYVLKHSLYIGYLNYLMENASTKQKLIQETLINVIQYLGKKQFQLWPCNIQNVLMNMQDKLGKKINLIQWEIMIAEIERANYDHEYFKQIVDKLDYFNNMIIEQKESANLSSVVNYDSGRKRSRSYEKIQKELSQIPDLERLQPFWVPIFLYSRQIMQPNQIFNIYLNYFNEATPRGDPTDEQLTMIYRIMVGILQICEEWLGRGIEYVSREDYTISENVVTLVNYLTKVEDVTDRILGYMRETKQLVASRTMLDMISKKSEAIKRYVSTLTIWSRQDDIRRLLTIEASRRPEVHSERKH